MATASIDEQLEQLDKLNLNEPDNEALATLKKSLGIKNNRVVAKAARLCAENHLYQFTPEIKRAFLYFADKVEKDKNCYAKKAIVKTLYELDFIDTEFYSLAIGFRQMEPVWGGSVDTAIDVRCWAAYGLTLSANTRIILQLLELLHDPEPQARLGAVKAIAHTNPLHAEVLLREKVLDGDVDAYVIGECFRQLVANEPEENLAFVKRYLDHDQEEWVEYAALAIAESNDPTAFEILRDAIDQAFYDTKKQHLIKALSLHRSKHALTYLLELLESAGTREAVTIIEALSIYRGNDDISQQVKAVVHKGGQTEAKQALEVFWS